MEIFDSKRRAVYPIGRENSKEWFKAVCEAKEGAAEALDKAEDAYDKAEDALEAVGDIPIMGFNLTLQVDEGYIGGFAVLNIMDGVYKFRQVNMNESGIKIDNVPFTESVIPNVFAVVDNQAQGLTFERAIMTINYSMPFDLYLDGGWGLLQSDNTIIFQV